MQDLQDTLTKYSADASKMIEAMEFIAEAMEAAEREVEEEEATEKGEVA